MKLSILLKSVTEIRRVSIVKEGMEHKHAVETGRYNDLCACLPDYEIGSIHYRAQEVKPNGLFVAVKGFKADGHDFIDEALARGASIIVTQKPVNKESAIIEVENTRRALAAISANFYGNASEKLFIIGITGTNGKTTTAYIIESILAEAGFRVGVIGTINYRYAGRVFPNPMTTPEALDLQKILAEMHENGITHVVLEVSSHAIDLHRIDCCRIDIGVFTNLTRDHLDYHGDMDSYWFCKKRLFTEHLKTGPKKSHAMAVVNCDDKRGKGLYNLLSEASDSMPVISTGSTADKMIWPDNIKYSLTGITGKISTKLGTFNFKSPLAGEHNLENILSATGVGIALGLSSAIIKAGIEKTGWIPGRLEFIPNKAGKFVFVDYAHTPDALEHVLSSLKSIKDNEIGRIICVVGCGGDRDRGKRPQMGEIAGRLCDLAIITSDNPRTEDPMEIISRIIEGIKQTPSKEHTLSDLAKGIQEKGYVIEPDRRKAIKLSITSAGPGDIILIAGKGHETYQLIGGETFPFDDREEAREALKEQIKR
ncbi:MAG: UDP-N-acetylmuramoyl-L-alanyl-D-glutamate--2,6-diaminopimelate ligase [Desulfobacteraceae bacterium]|nr:UDP-N-acetylmuramoyl-L-alanyl-D-glutamate--2,6-diaminopimelate ligase [Desulfobacteraceae bacterium]